MGGLGLTLRLSSILCFFMLTLMKSAILPVIVVFTLAVQQLPAQVADDSRDFAITSSDVLFAPLPLFTSGAGRIFPFEDGQMFQVGHRYVMVAIPDRGYVFTNWMPVNVFTFSIVTYDQNGVPLTTVSTEVSPVFEYIRHPILKFAMPPEEETIAEFPGFLKITRSSGWQGISWPGGERCRPEEIPSKS